MDNSLLALSPLDGRYAAKVAPLCAYFSEYALIKARLTVEIAWLRLLAKCEQIPEVLNLTPSAETFLSGMLNNFSLEDAKAVKAFEATTNHDVKAVEYFLKQKMASSPELALLAEFVHFACTSEDINNCAYGLLIKEARDKVLLPKLEQLLQEISDFAKQHRALAMLARTHGQAATPTTLGKEWANVHARLARQVVRLTLAPVSGKFNGAVGNFNAHHIAYPSVDWRALSQKMVESLGLSHNAMTTQIEPHDDIANLLHTFMQINTVLIDFSRDCWSYISLSYLTLKTKAGEIGSSTMPHKVNPIDFENAEGNLSLANALAGFLASRLPLSRWQRDLVDSTLLRNIGSAFAYGYLAIDSLLRGFAKITPDEARIAEDLAAHPEILAEAIQTVMRRYGLELPYEQLKTLTRGQAIDLSALRDFIATQDLPLDVKTRLLALTPATYLGLSVELVEAYLA